MVNPTGPREVWFAIRSDGAKGRGTRDDPYDGSEVAEAQNTLRFDNILRLEVPANTVIHLGPGVFKTRGGRGADRAVPIPWEPRNGQKIIGSGMFATTLKLKLNTALDTTQSNVVFNAIGGPFSNFTSYEVSDLTIDCDLSGQPAAGSDPYPKITCAGLVIHGTNIKVHRVRVINWGRRGADKECFPH